MNTHIDSLRNFYNGKYYPLFAALLIFLGHALGQEIVFGALLLLSIIPACFVCRDLRFAVIPFLCTVFIVSAKGYSPNDTGYDRFLKPVVLIPLICILVLLIAALVYFIVRNRKLTNAFPRDQVFISLAVFCGTLFFNGIFSSQYTPKNLFFAFAMSLSLVAVYVLFALYYRFDKTSNDHLMYCLVISAFLIIAELFWAYCTTVQFENGEIVKGSVVLGWGVWTNIGGMLAFLLPACFYFAANHRHGWIGFLLGFIDFFCIVLSQSRGALVVGAVVLLLCLVYLCLCGKNRKRNRIFTLVIAIGGIAFCVLFAEKMLGLVNNFLQYGFGDNGRFDLWKTGIAHFLDYPVFGSGFYDSYVNEAWDMPIYPYLYHNTLVQMLGAAGIVGFLAYAYHRFCAVKLVLRRPNPAKTFFGLCILTLLAFSLLDVLFFKTYPTIYYSLMLLFMVKSDSTEPQSV